MAGVTKEYTANHRKLAVGNGKVVTHRYEVLDLDADSVTLRLHPAGGTSEPFEERLTFTDPDTMREVVDGVPHTLRRQ